MQLQKENSVHQIEINRAESKKSYVYEMDSSLCYKRRAA